MKLPPFTWIVAAVIILGAVGLVLTADWETAPPPEPSENSSGERDTTAEEVRAAATQINEMEQRLEEQAAAARRDDELLQQDIQQQLSALETAMQNFTIETPQEVITALGDISSRITALEDTPVTGFDPQALDYAVGADPSPGIIWVESLTSQSSATAAALEVVAPPPPPPPDPRYTLPPATIIDATALTALVGRVPIDGRIESPWRFKLLSTALNMTSRRFQVPNLEGVIWSGVAYGDYTLSCVSGTIDTVSYVFADGTVHSQRSEANPDDITAGIGWISDVTGNPCVPGEFKTNAPEVLRRLVTAGTIEGLARGYADAQTSRTTDSEGRTSSTVTGDADEFALATAVGEAVSESNRWLLRRLSDSFDAIYVPAGAALAIHIEQQVAIDHDSVGRRIVHQQQARARVLRDETLGGHD